MDEALLKRAKLRCLHLLEKMDRTEYQLRTKLKQSRQNYSEEIIEQAIAYVKSYGYVDDMSYACQYIRLRQESRSKKQIEWDLMKKGIDKEVISMAFQESTPVDERKLIGKLLEKKKANPSQMDRKEKQKLYGFLMRKGFSPALISSVIWGREDFD